LFVCVVLSVVESIDDMGGFLESADITARARVSTAAVIVSFFVAFLLIAVRSKEVGLAGRLAFLGALTYPLYLTHNIAKAALLSLGDGLHPYLRLVIAVSFSLALSSLMVLVIERRMRKPCTEFLTRCYQRLAVPRGS
jgi:peptidoglycan/LPS O-acetylase OafA/YrhL